MTVSPVQQSAAQAAESYGMSEEQKAQIQELLSGEYRDLWASLLGGYHIGSGEILQGDIRFIGIDIFDFPMQAGDYSLTSGYGYRSDPFTGEIKFHGGQDLGATEGTPILAAADGTVTVANTTDSWGYGWGYYVKINHNGTYDTLYAHCSIIAVTRGQEVKKGKVIAYIGSTGASTGPHNVKNNEMRSFAV